MCFEIGIVWKCGCFEPHKKPRVFRGCDDNPEGNKKRLCKPEKIFPRQDSKRPQETHYCRKCDLTSTSSIALVPIPPQLRQLAVACLRIEILKSTEKTRRARIKELVTHVEHSSLFLELDCEFSEMLDLSEKVKAKSVAMKTEFYVFDDYERCQEMGIVP